MVPGIGWFQGGMQARFAYPFIEEGIGDEPEPSESPHISVGDISRPSHEFLGFEVGINEYVTTTWLTPHRFRIEGTRLRAVSFRYYTPAFASAILPTIWLILMLRRRRNVRRRTEGRCTICGYDLRASVGRCPECGTPIQQTDSKTVASNSA
jgi:hypothetical protein